MKATARLRFPHMALRKRFLADGVERNLSLLPVNDGCLEVAFEPRQIKTKRVVPVG